MPAAQFRDSDRVRRQPSYKLSRRFSGSDFLGSLEFSVFADAEFPQRNDRNEFREEQVEQRHGRETRTENDDLRPSRSVRTPRVRSRLIRKRWNDDEEPLEPHSDNDTAGRDHTSGDGAHLADRK